MQTLGLMYLLSLVSKDGFWTSILKTTDGLPFYSVTLCYYFVVLGGKVQMIMPVCLEMLVFSVRQCLVVADCCCEEIHLLVPLPSSCGSLKYVPYKAQQPELSVRMGSQSKAQILGGQCVAMLSCYDRDNVG